MNRRRGFSRTTIQALLATTAIAQFSNWPAHQVNTSICLWEQPRAALVRDVVYLDGGDIYWRPWLDSGQFGDIVAPENFQGLILTYNLSESFSVNTNTTGILLKDMLSKAPGGIGNTNGASPNYYDGAMLANDDQFFLYGGAPFKNDQQYALPDKGAYIEYQASQYGDNKPQFQPGIHNLELPNPLTRYIAYGGASNAPSENKAWYFSGLTSPSRGPIVENGASASTASNASNTLISVDMSTQNFPKWSNKTLPPKIQPRSNAAVVWVPVGGQGILAVLGGTTYPDWANVARASFNESGSEDLDAAFMSTIDIYDIENDVWYKQPTNAGGNNRSLPSARSRGCAVVAPASDLSSFNIFYYGGYDGLHPQKPFFDEVWALSLPSFSWSKINAGTPSHARAGHQCFSPYPDQMMVFGGSTPFSGATRTCLEDGPVLNFNLTSGTWMESYDPTKYGPYGVHQEIITAIGGSPSGGSTVTQPVGAGWNNASLGNVFATQYDRTKLKQNWPYPPAKGTEQSTSSTPSPPKMHHHGDSGLPKWAPPVVGVVTGLAALACAAALFFICRRRRQTSKRRSRESSDDFSRPSRFSRLIAGRVTPEKSRTPMSSMISPMSPEPKIATPSQPTPDIESAAYRQEMPDTQLVELDASNTRSELQDTGLSRPEIWQRYSHWIQGQQTSPATPSEVSFSMSGYPTSNNPSIYRSVGDGTPRVDSPPLGGIGSAVGRPPPLPELNEDEIPGPRQSSPTISIAEMGRPDSDVEAGPPDTQRSDSSSNSQQRQEPQHVAFHVKDKNSIEYISSN